MSRQSRLSTNNNGDNVMMPGLVHRSTGIYLTAEEKPAKLQLGPSDEGCKTSHHFNWDHLHPNEIGTITQHVKEGEGKDGVM